MQNRSGFNFSPVPHNFSHFNIHAIFISIVRRKKIFERKIFNSVVGVSFPFPDFAHDAQTLCRIAGILYHTYVWDVATVEKPEEMGSNPADGGIFHTFLGNR